MRNIVIKRFYDKQDEKNHVYCVGDDFPKKGIEVTPERIKELSTKNNAVGVPLIKVIQELKEVAPVQEDNKANNKTIKVEKETSDPKDGNKGKQKD